MKHKNAVLLIISITILGLLLIIILMRTPGSYIWVIDEGNALNQTYLVKLCPNGAEKVRLRFGQSGAIGVDPRDGTVWAPELNDVEEVIYDQIVHVDAHGRVMQRVEGYRTSILAVDPIEGDVWIALPNEAQLVKLAPSGAPVLQVPGSDGPAAIAVDPRDNSIWVAYYGAQTLTHLSSQGAVLFVTTTPGYFSNAPHQIAVDPRNGDVWYVGAHDGSIYKRSSLGELLVHTSGFDRPVSVAINPYDGSIWVADFSVKTAGATVKLGANGTRITTRVLDSPPHVVGFNPSDRTVWVGIDGALVKLSDKGETLAVITGFTKPNSLAFYSITDNLSTKLDYIWSCWVSF